MAALLPAVLRRDLGTAFLRSPNCFFVIRRFEQRRLQRALIFGIEIERRIQADLREARRVTDQSRAPRRHGFERGETRNLRTMMGCRSPKSLCALESAL